MPSTSSTVGKLQLPLPAVSGPIDDPGLTILASYLAFRLNDDLNPQLATLNTANAVDGSFITTAVPSGNVFLWNPTKPNAFFTRGAQDGASKPLPALYVWDDTDKRQGFGNLHGMRVRTVMAAWIFEQAVLPGWHVDRYGLRAAACASMFRAVEQGWHPSFNPTASIAMLMGLSGHGIVYQGSERSMLSPVVSATEQSDQPSVWAYPAAVATFQAYEREDGMTALPGETVRDLLVQISTGDDPQNPVVVANKVVPAPPYESTT